MYEMPNPYLERLRQYQPQQQSYDALVRVTGIQGARAYPMPPNSSAVLFDNNSDTMYIRTTDGGGFPSLRVFDFKPHEEPAPVSMDQFVTRKEFEELKEVLQNAQQSVRKPKSAE